jgi:endonuclease I
MHLMRKALACLFAMAPVAVLADASYHPLANGPLTQDWSNDAQISAPNNWADVPSFEGYRSGNVPGATNDPRTIVDFAGALLNVTPDVANLVGYGPAGLIEATLPDPALGLQATNNNDVVFLLLHLDTTGCSAVQLDYRLRDLDADTAIQPYLLQSRLGASVNFAAVPGTFVANANTGIDLPFSVALPAALLNQSQVQLRWITNNVAGADAIIGVDDIAVSGTCSGGVDGTPDPLPANVQFGFTVVADAPPTLASSSPANGAINVPLAGNLQLAFSEPVSVSGAWYAISCASSGSVAASVGGGPQNWALDPLSNFAALELCTLTLQSALIGDLDGLADPLSGSATIGFTSGSSSTDYYAGVNTTSPAALRSTLHALIDDHTAFPYSSNTATDTWDILEVADQDPTDTSKVLDVYRNRKYTKIVDRSGATGPGTYNREHTWPNSLGFNDLSGPDAQSRPYSPYVDTHMLYLSASDYNGNRGNKPYATCSASCSENPTDANNGQGGGSGIYPGNSNWVQQPDGNTGTYEVWTRRKGDMARAILYMDIRYEGGSAANGQPEPDLIVTDNRGLIAHTPSGQVPALGYMGLLSALLAWHAADPPDAQEQLRNDVIFSFQGNRNPFIDRPEFAACLWQNQCAPGDSVFGNGFEP